MTEKDLLRRLREIAQAYDPEENHYEADQALLEYINDPDITAAYNEIEKWYA